jgi:hypothetical protein
MSTTMLSRLAGGVAVLAIIAAIWQYNVANSARQQLAAAESAKANAESQLKQAVSAREAAEKQLADLKSELDAANTARANAEQAAKDAQAQLESAKGARGGGRGKGARNREGIG